MDSDFPSPTQENKVPKAEFRKPTNEAASRKYRRRSPDDLSTDEDGGSKHSRRGNSKVSDYERRNDDRVAGKSYSRSQHGHSSDSYMHSSRGNRHDDYSRYSKHAHEDDRIHTKSSYRSVRESRGGTHYRDRESDYNRSRDHYRDVDRYSRDRKYRDKDLSSDRTVYDGSHGNSYDDHDTHSRDRDDRVDKREFTSSRDRDNRSDRTNSREDGHRIDSNLKREIGDLKDLDGLEYSQEGKNKNDELDSPEDRHVRLGVRSEHQSASINENFTAKRPKLFSLEDHDARKVDERQTSGFKQGEQLVAKVTSERASDNVSDFVANVDAAKVAAMKAAELVNKNLIGTGVMTADQKKKLLWGSKKSNNIEESSHKWDTSLFSDRERQEKFNKLMGVKGDMKVDNSRPPPTPSSQDAEKQREQLQLDLEKQYTAGLRRRDGRTVGLGL